MKTTRWVCLVRPFCPLWLFSPSWKICLIWLTALACCSVPSMAHAEASEAAPLMSQPAWQKLNDLAADLPFTWARRYLELQSIAEDTDNYSLNLPLQLQNLREVTAAAQKNVVTLLLDMVPAQSNIQETTYLIGLLDNWAWKLEPPLRRTAATAAGLQHSLEVLAGIGKAVEEMQRNPKKRPIMEKTSQDFYDLFVLVNARAYQLHTELNAVRSEALGLFTQIELTTSAAKKQLPAKWVEYYTTPLTISSRAFSHLGSDFLTMNENWTYTESYLASLPFAIVFNTVLFCCLALVHTVLLRVVNTVQQNPLRRTFAQNLCCEFNAQDARRKLAFVFCTVVMLNTMVDALPLVHAGIPYLMFPQVFMPLALATWARTSPNDPSEWELSLPIMVGILLLHGDARSLLILLGMGGAMLLPVISLLLKGIPNLSTLSTFWLAALLMGVLLTSMGLGRITVPLLMLIVMVRAATTMLNVVNNSPSLKSHTMARTCFVPLLTLFLGLVGITLLVSCSGFGMLRNYWYANAIPVLGLHLTFGDAILTLLFLLGILFAFNISRQVLENLAHESRILDASAVPVLQVVIKCILVGIFGFFVVSALGMDITSLAFIGGGVSIGVGFAAKTILSNFFCGLVLIFSKAVRAGDIVDIDGVTGRVLSVNMRATVVETLSNSILLVPNENLLGDCLTNWSLNNLHVLEDIVVNIDRGNDVNAAVAAMEEAVASVAGVMTDPPPHALFTDFGENSMHFVLKVWVRDVRTRLTTLSEIRKALVHKLAEQGIVMSLLVTRQLDVSINKKKQRENSS